MPAAKKSHASLLRHPSNARAAAAAAPSAPTARDSRPPKAPPPRKATHAAECTRLDQLPNIGPSLATDLRDVGITQPHDLVGKDAYALYRQLCLVRGTRQDPCVLDTFMAVVDFMSDAAPQPWWAYTAERKQRYRAV